MLKGIRRKQTFSFDEYRIMLSLQCGVDLTGGDTGARTTDRNYNLYLNELHELERQAGSEDKEP